MKPEEAIARFLASRQLSASGRGVYENYLSKAAVWCVEKDVDFLALPESDWALLAHDMSATRRWAPSTVAHQQRILRLFYSWLATGGKPSWQPAPIQPQSNRRQRSRLVLTISDLQMLWTACADNAQERTLFSLLTFCALRCDDVFEADVSDIRTMGSHRALSIRNPRRRADLGYTLIPPDTWPAMDECVAERKTGPLLLNARGKSMSQDSQSHVIARLGAKTSLQERLTPSTLSFVLRGLAVDASFSLLSVVRSLGQLKGDSLAPWVERTNAPIDDHAALHAAALVIPRPPHVARLEKAKRLLWAVEYPPTLAAVLAASTLEDLLREVGRAQGLNIDEDRAKLSTYGEKLRVAGLLSNADIQLMKRIEEIRNWAAHGWFDKVGTKESEWLINEVERMIYRQEPHLRRRAPDPLEDPDEPRFES